MEMTITGKGQFTLSKVLMEHLGIRPGDRVSVTKTPEGVSITAAKNRRSVQETLQALDELRAGRTFESVSVEEMNRVIGQCYADAGAAGLK